MERLRPGFASRRKEPRYPGTLACVGRWPGGDGRGGVVDLAAEGASISIDRVPPEGTDRFDITVFPEDDHPLVLAAQALSIERDPLGGWLVRVRFVDLPAETASVLAALLEGLRGEFNLRQARIAMDRLAPSRRNWKPRPLLP